MRETLSVREAREQLSTLLRRFRRGERTLIGFGPHRKAEAAIVPIEVLEVLEELTAERTRSLQQAAGSVRAEGLTVSAEAKAITERWARGEITTAQMHELIRRLYDVS